jgi:hypothetical protein
MSQAKPNPNEMTNATRRRGQALAEFALTLPILLLLVFGIIEFARLFQTWVVLQSAARAGARAASIGMIDYEIFNVPADAQPIDLRVLNAVIPCSETDQRGAIVTHSSGVKYYDGTEGLFATMYDGTDCDPSNEDHTQYRKDILRIFTVISEVRETAGTIAVYNDRVDQAYNSITPEQAFDFFKGYWSSPYKNPANASSPGWLSVEICSTRPLINGTSSAGNAVETRFATIRNSTEVVNANGNPHNYPVPFCKLNEIPAVGNDDLPRPDALDNHDYRWFDVGGPGDRVTVFIKFNHPLITPLNLAQYVPLESRRASVNESFRAPKAVGAFQRSIPPGRDPDEQGPQPTETEPGPTPTTVTATNRPPPTLTHTPLPFSCENITVEWASNPFMGQQLNLTVRNNNNEQTELSRARISWNAHANWQLMYAQDFLLDGNPHWRGGPSSSPPQTMVDTQLHGTFDEGSRRVVAGKDTGTWSAFFANGPSNLFTAFRLNDFDVELVFLDPVGNPCSVILIQVEQPTPTASRTPTAGPSPTPTPFCGLLTNVRPPRFGGYDSFNGSVYFEIENTGQQPVYLLGFELVWPDPNHPEVDADPGQYHLRRVFVGGISTDDPQAVEVWRSSAEGQDATGNTKTTIPYDVATRSTGSEGTWLTPAVLQPGITRIWLDFDGFGGSIRQFDVLRHHFNGSRFFIGHIEGCTQGPGNPSLPSTAVVQATLPSPGPTNTPRPTNPPQPTSSPTPVTPTEIPSATSTRAPTNTSQPATATSPAPSRTPIGGLTPTGGAGGD